MAAQLEALRTINERQRAAIELAFTRLRESDGHDERAEHQIALERLAESDGHDERAEHQPYWITWIPSGGQFGNQIFTWASMVGIAASTGARLCRQPMSTALGEVADAFVGPLPPPCPPDVRFLRENYWHEGGWAKYRPMQIGACPGWQHSPCPEGPRPRGSRWPLSEKPNVLLPHQYLTSYKHFAESASAVRRLLQFHAPLKAAAQAYLRRVVPVGRTAVGVHVRRGDKIRDSKLRLPALSFYRNALSHFKAKYSDAFFVIASDDLTWCLQQAVFASNPGDVHVISERHDSVTVNDKCPCHDCPKACPKAEDGIWAKRKVSPDLTLDFAILASCEHVVVSAGTYGYWAAWLAGGDVVYFPGEYIMTAQDNIENFRAEDRYPPEWVAIDD